LQPTAGQCGSPSGTPSYDGIPERPLLRMQPPCVARKRCDPDLCEEPRPRLFNQSQMSVWRGEPISGISSQETSIHVIRALIISALITIATPVPQVSASDECPPVPAISAHQCQQSVPTTAHKCHQSVPISDASPGWLSVPPISAAHQCLSLLSINAHPCHPSVPSINAQQCHQYRLSVPPISAHQCRLSVPTSAAYQCQS
ncbi:hypothetical protein AB205_0050280, partial [Aquarana catesbeiana]